MRLLSLEAAYGASAGAADPFLGFALREGGPASPAVPPVRRAQRCRVRSRSLLCDQKERRRFRLGMVPPFTADPCPLDPSRGRALRTARLAVPDVRREAVPGEAQGQGREAAKRTLDAETGCGRRAATVSSQTTLRRSA